MTQPSTTWSGRVVSRPVRLQDIEAAAVQYFMVPRILLIGPSRARPLVQYRQVAMSAARELGYTTTQIGHWFGGRDHTTVMHACDAVSNSDALAAWRDDIVHNVTADWVSAVPFKTRRKG